MSSVLTVGVVTEMGAYCDGEMKKAIQSAYGLPVDDVKWVDSLYAKSVVACLTAAGKRFAWKRWKTSASAIYGLYQKHRFVAEADLAPIWHLTKNGQKTLTWQGNIYYLTDWADGRRFEANPDDAYALGGILRKLHSMDVSSLGRDMAKPFAIQSHLPRVYRVARLLQRDQTPVSCPTEARQFLARHRANILHDIEQSLDSLKSQQPILLPCLVHGDVTVPNVLIHHNQARLIDWERLGFGIAMEELAKTAMNVCNLSPQMVERLLDGYGKDSLATREMSVFRAFMRIPREVIYLLLRGNRQSISTADTSLWQQIISTWEDRQKLLSLFG